MQIKDDILFTKTNLIISFFISKRNKYRKDDILWHDLKKEKMADTPHQLLLMDKNTIYMVLHKRNWKLSASNSLPNLKKIC